MTNHYDSVRRFHANSGQGLPNYINKPSEERRLLRARLIIEEALETIEALGVTLYHDVGHDGWSGERGDIHIDNVNLSIDDDSEFDIQGVVDGCADLSVVAMGTMVECGVQDDEPVLQEVDLSNLAKTGPGSWKRSDGKIMKPANWSTPDVMGAIDGDGVYYTNTEKTEHAEELELS